MPPKEVLRSSWMSGRMLEKVTVLPYGKAAEDFNKDMFREKDSERDCCLSMTTLQYFAETNGNRMHDMIIEESERHLREAGYDSKTGERPKSEDGSASVVQITGIPDESVVIPEEIQVKIDEYNRGKSPEFQIKDSTLIRNAIACYNQKDEIVNVFQDGVLVHKQKEDRSKAGEHAGRSKRKWLEITNTAIGFGGEMLRFPASSQEEAGMLTSAALVANGLEDKRIVAFSDGAKCIRANVEKVFGDRVCFFILDMLHIDKKLAEKISSGVKGSFETKKKLRSRLYSMLWVGNVDDFIRTVSELPDSSVKNRERLDELTVYVESRKDAIACYALRAILGLKNSSNEAELSNRMIVTQREKNAAMSWSKDGSLALAAIRASIINGCLETYVTGGKMSLKFFNKAS